MEHGPNLGQRRCSGKRPTVNDSAAVEDAPAALDPTCTKGSPMAGAHHGFSASGPSLEMMATCGNAVFVRGDRRQ
jgi:hypothetical protein